MVRKEHKNTQQSDGYFSQFSQNFTDIAGNFWTFLTACLIVIIWLITGPIFHYSDTWQLIINTGTTIITFLMVFLIQHTQNRDMVILNLKINELIKAHHGAKNARIDLAKLSDEQLKILEKEYIKLCHEKQNSKKD